MAYSALLGVFNFLHCIFTTRAITVADFTMRRQLYVTPVLHVQGGYFSYNVTYRSKSNSP